MLANLWPRITYVLADFKWYLLTFFVVTLLLVTLLFLFRRRWFLSLLATGYMLLAILMSAEFYYRYIFDTTDNVFHIKTTQRWIARHVVWNGNGYRDDHFFPDKDSRETRIIFLGDSYTFGYGLKNVNSRYSELLGEKLRQNCSAGKTVKTYNLGLPGNQSQTYLKMLVTEVFRFQPDAIVMQYYLDDIGGDTLPGQDPGFAQTIYAYKQTPILGFLLKHSYALEYWYVRLAGRLSPRHDWGQFINFNESLYRDRPTWQRHLSTLQHIVAATRGSRPVPLAVFILPLSHRLGPDYPLTDIHQQLTDYLTNLNVPVIDMLPILNRYRPKQIMVSRSDYHLNEFGHQLIADNLYPLVKDLPGFTCQ